MKTIKLIVILFLMPFLSAVAKTYQLEGMIGGKYSIVIELEEFDQGLFSGRYAYLSTLRKNGDIGCSWLSINPSHDSPYSEWVVKDCKLDWAETWYNVRFCDRKHLTARMKNAKGKYYDVVATVKDESSVGAPLNAYFKQHIGDMVCDFDMFNDHRVKSRLIDFMGVEPYSALKNIYQTQGDIEYSKGMYWGSGFMVHQCCDPATVWAYDTGNNSFYVWIRIDGKDYWWSESGNIPYEFRELVDSAFGLY